MTVAAPLFIAPLFKERVWGGTTLREWFGDLVPPGTIGECWAISGLPGDAGTVTDGPGAGGTLDDAWRQGLITGSPQDGDFPILVKFLDPADWLSVQVHPNDAQAGDLEGMPRGKSECWYVVQCEPGAELIMGHTGTSAESLREAFDEGTLDEHLLRHHVEPGSFFVVPAGCVHAVGPGMLVYEVQQSSDITYRLYDFDRPGLDGRPRELHLDKGFSVVTAPYDLAQSFTAGQPRRVGGGQVGTLVDGPFFTVKQARVHSAYSVGSTTGYELLTVVEGRGVLVADGRSHPLPRGTSAVLPTGCTAEVHGEVTVIVTHPGPSA